MDVRARLRPLVDDGTLTAAQADAVAAALAEERKTAARGPGNATVAASYVGVGLIVAAVCTLLAQQWDEMGVATRSFVTAATTVLLVGAGAVLKRDLDQVRGLLWLVAVGSAAGFGAAVRSGGDGEGVGAAVAATVLASALLALRRSEAQLVGFVGGVVALAVSLIGDTAGAVAAGATLWGLGAAIAVAGALRVLPAGQLAMGLGALVALVGAEVVFFENEGLGAAMALALAAAGYVAALTDEDAVVPLTTATVVVAVMGPQILGDWLDASIGVSGVLLVSGLIVLGAVALHIRLVRRRGDG